MNYKTKKRTTLIDSYITRFFYLFTNRNDALFSDDRKRKSYFKTIFLLKK